MTTQLYRPSHRDLTYCGATADGRVMFTTDGGRLLDGRYDGLTPGAAKELASELLAAAGVADEFLVKIRGDHLYRSEALDGGCFLVHHRGTTQRMRPIRNSVRKRRLGAWTCTGCRKESPSGDTMYVPDGVVHWQWRHTRLCIACVSPSEKPSMAVPVAFRGGA